MLVEAPQIIGSCFVAAFGALPVIGKGLVHILLAPQAPLVAVARLALSPGMTICRRFFIHGQCLVIIMGDLLAGEIQVAQEVCGVRVPQVGRLLVQLYGPAQADRYPNAVFIAHTQGADPIGIVLLCRLGVQLYRSGGIHFHPAAHLIVQP